MPSHSSGHVEDPGRDRRVTDAERFIHDRRTEALAMFALWSRSTKPHADGEMTYWRGVLRELDMQAARLMQREEHR